MGAGGRAQPGGLTRAPQTPTALQKPLQRATHPSHSATLINFAAKAGTPTLPSQRSPPLMPELDTFPLHSQTSPSPRPLTEQSFIKLFHALSGRGAPGDGGLFRPFVGAPQDRPA